MFNRCKSLVPYVRCHHKHAKPRLTKNDKYSSPQVAHNIMENCILRSCKIGSKACKFKNSTKEHFTDFC